MNELRELRITRVGAQGDGVADDSGSSDLRAVRLNGRAGRR